MLYVETGVWHNPRIIKQKQYIPKYALTVTIVLEEYKLPDLIHNDWFVSKQYVIRIREPIIHR